MRVINKWHLRFQGCCSERIATDNKRFFCSQQQSLKPLRVRADGEG